VIHAGATADSSSELGDYSVLFRNVRLTGSSLGAYSYVQENSALYRTEVGPFCSIAAGVTIGLMNHPISMVSTSPVFYDNTQPLPRFFSSQDMHPQKPPKTVIEADVWIGEGAKIMAGVRVGVGSVIGAGAVVTRDIPPYTVAAGIPCRPIKDRFPESVRSRMLDTRWWELGDKVLVTLAPYFADPEKFLSAINVAKHTAPVGRRD
jgi:acetyltransferase-like isoleucine patch superfamily enzyme